MYAIVDIETTGMSSFKSGITEIAICLHNGQSVVDRYMSLINPGYPIPAYITRLTGISNEMVSDAPFFDEVAGAIYAILKDHVFVAHNVSFDYSFVQHALKAAGFNLNVQKLCTVRMSRKVFPGLPSYSLGNICRSLGISNNNRHRAMGDAAATAELFERMIQHKGEKFIHKMLGYDVVKNISEGE